MQRLGARRRGHGVGDAGAGGEALLDSAVRGPDVSQPERSVATTDATSSSPITGGEKSSIVGGRASRRRGRGGCRSRAHRTSNLTASMASEARASARRGRAGREHVAGPVGRDAKRPVDVAGLVEEVDIGRPGRRDELARRRREELDHRGARWAGARAIAADPLADRRQHRRGGQVDAAAVRQISESCPPPSRAATSTTRGPSSARISWM